MRSLLALVAAGLLAGCAAPDGLGFARDADAPEPYYKEHRALLAGEHHKTYAVPVESGAQALLVRVDLEWRDHGLAVPTTPLATLRVVLVAPDGIVAQEGTLDAERPTLRLDVPSPLVGAYEVRVDGFGASHDLDGRSYGTGYLLAAEVSYAR